jgi:predicted RecB family nuclease
MNINFAVDKAYESKSLKELVNAPVAAIQGVSEGDAKHLKEAFGIDTIADLAHNKYFGIAQAIVQLAKLEEKSK